MGISRWPSSDHAYAATHAATVRAAHRAKTRTGLMTTSPFDMKGCADQAPAVISAPRGLALHGKQVGAVRARAGVVPPGGAVAGQDPDQECGRCQADQHADEDGDQWPHHSSEERRVGKAGGARWSGNQDE